MTKHIRAILLAAMEEEFKPLLDKLNQESVRPRAIRVPVGKAWLAVSTQGNYLIVKTGVGPVAAATALTWALSMYSPQLIVMTGSAGGLTDNLDVGTVVVGWSYRYWDVDATYFGYEKGQLPGEPELFRITEHSPNRVMETLKEMGLEGKVVLGQIVSGSSFVTPQIAAQITRDFPSAMAVDMESAAVAQVANTFGIPFGAVRAISDIAVDETGEAQYHLGQNMANTAAADVALQIVGYFASRRGLASTRHFSDASIRTAIFYIFGKAQHVEPGDIDTLPDEIVRGIKRHVTDPDTRYDVMSIVAGGYAALKADDTLSLTVKEYDACRAEILAHHHISSGRGQLTWPPTSQTIIKRYNGYWTDALKALGMKTHPGRRRGGLKFDRDDYIHALQDFGADCARKQTTPSYKLYQEWVKAQNKSVPSGAAVRQHFGSWSAAAREAKI